MTEPMLDTFTYKPDEEWNGWLIATGTNPFITLNGSVCNWGSIPWPDLHGHKDCDQCGYILPGVCENMDTPEGVQRCDNCCLYEDDLSAAQALADWLDGGVVRYYGMKVCYACGEGIYHDPASGWLTVDGQDDFCEYSTTYYIEDRLHHP